MAEEIYKLIDFKEYLPLKVDITNQKYLVYEPSKAPTKILKPIEPALSEEELYFHMKTHSNWSFSKGNQDDFYKQECISFLRDIDFQSFLQYGKLTKLDFIKAKSAYVFDSFLRNFLQEILERIEIFLKKSTADAILRGYNKDLYIFEDDELYYSEGKYSKEKKSRKERVCKTKYHLSKLVLDNINEKQIKKQLDEYGVVLPWTVFRLMTFGNISSFLVALQPEYRNKVADYVSDTLSVEDRIPAKVLLSWSNALRYLRNICSHNKSLYGRSLTVLPMVHTVYKDLFVANQNNDEKKLFIYFTVMRHITLAMSNESQTFWDKKLDNLSEISSYYKIDLTYYGFPNDWIQKLRISK